MKSTRNANRDVQPDQPTIQELTKLLNERNIRPSQQRLMILAYLRAHHTHPSVDMIYSALQKSVPTLSRATVYNTLNLFLEAGLVRALALVEKEKRYYGLTHVHGHFRCNACGTIFNFSVHEDNLTADELSGFEIDEKSVYFKGLCPKCRKK